VVFGMRRGIRHRFRRRLGGGELGVRQSSERRSHDLNLNVLGEAGLINGALGNALNGEGNPGAQSTTEGSTLECDNSAFSR
jgi:hypothetical protein